MTPSVELDVLPNSSTEDSHQHEQLLEEDPTDHSDACQIEMDLLDVVTSEIEQMRRAQQRQRQETEAINASYTEGKRQSPPPPPTRQRLRHINSFVTVYHKFPTASLALLKHLPGNDRCVDCGVPDPQWAAVSYGAMLCLNCSGHHRSLGVQVSCVRSVTMDEWSLEQVLSMLEGGNAQLTDFFARHCLCETSVHNKQPTTSTDAATQAKIINKSNVTRLRYKTKAALFYRQQMSLHIDRLLKTQAPYRGRRDMPQQPQSGSLTIRPNSNDKRSARGQRVLERRNTVE
mmetsp:Transcript_604/g.1242  ORF Transcript_604/g.1242 Transcript_604/m.1242 type:complete len:288 (-) Transcript_604:169-1032(-)|eukprot:CAMPEP_0168750032 /NCGR_PEP_ID=MMETSP0724-20121128/17043_1 /TAXON_ID=265536 /ORGANISM="Amphiprora sp., Strain CCMP467" /LENGTH=287 /DNA_ID=CAMNT_0008798001 /DNA_START=357 /DNA_END=1223 /DNA_ORIENTATION=+